MNLTFWEKVKSSKIEEPAQQHEISQTLFPLATPNPNLNKSVKPVQKSKSLQQVAPISPVTKEIVL
jgi:hypothetical protein